MLRRALLAAPALLLPGAGLAQAWPARPVRIVIPFPPGGLADQLARPLAARLQAVLGQPFLVENRAGAGGNIAADVVAKAAPDGHTWLLGSIGPLAANQFLFPAMPYDTRTAFAPVSLLVNTPKVVVVNPARPWRSLAEMLAAARERPGALRAGSAGNGSSLHLALEIMNRRAGVEITHVPYRGAAPAVTDLIAGTIDLMVDNLPNILPQIAGGQVRALAVATAERLPQIADVPTAAEAGLPGFVFGAWFGLAGPARTPAEIVQRLSAAVDDALREPEIGGRWREMGAIVVGGTPEAFAAFIAAQTAELEAVIRAANIRAE
ncbi:Bug family tripartite tricarboxylate transporter substrate binding protein [Rubritepida flocculans]|uniref:Bug family tripartite tricarboxylate transporter substrate binding protein n=1 Tax=Rubritepida flocculans TaxID=182403 RepID=UPI0004839D99|nr:tripartite tricarboxylate transporter substrate binding protein [Rubritepida flocculans]